MNKKTEMDFGFSLVDEFELKAIERELANKVEAVTLTSEQYKEKFDILYEMVMILLRNLSKDPQKTYIYWPNRIEKVNEFIDKINELTGKEKT